MITSHSHSHSHAHDHGHPHHQAHSHNHAHHHGPATPHPAQPVAWSILCMTVLSRLAAAALVSAALWAFVFLAMK
jgi:hypothetical protein